MQVVLQEHPSEVFHKICVPHYNLCWLANYSMLDCWLGKRFADLRLLVFKSIFSEKDQGRENETFNDFSFFCYRLHMSLTAGCEKKMIMILLGEIF